MTRRRFPRVHEQRGVADASLAFACIIGSSWWWGLVLRGFRPHDPVCPPGAGVPLRLPWMEEAMADPRLVLKIAHVRTHRA